MLKSIASLLFAKTPASSTTDTFNLRRWFIFFVIYMILLTIVALAALHAWAAGGNPAMLRVWLAALYVFYLSLCCTFFPAPTAWIILLMASPVVALFNPAALAHSTGWSVDAASRLAPLFTVAVVAALGAAATAIANLNEYHIFTFLLRYGRVRKIRQTRLYLWAKNAFDVSPFALLFTFSFIPIPVDVIRWLAITAGYPRSRFTLAYFLGRFLRYTILAGAAVCFHLSFKAILIIQITLVALVLIRYIPRAINKFKTSSSQPLTSSEPCQSC
jgi:membrane protein YqaA with SNARE-associated domain